MGNYSTTKPELSQLNLFKEFITGFVANGTIAEDYIIVLQDDLRYSEEKADALNDEINTFQNFRPCKLNDNFYNEICSHFLKSSLVYTIHKREEWYADRPKEQIFSNETINSILIWSFAELCTNLVIKINSY